MRRETGTTPEMRPARFTARTRLTLVTSGLILAMGTAMVVLISIMIRYLPSYNFRTAALADGTAGSIGASLVPVPGATLDPSTTTTAPAPAGVAVAIGEVSSPEDLFRAALVIGITALVLLGALGIFLSYVMAGRILRPLRDLDRAASRAAAGELSHRLAPTGARDEFTGLATTFDTMLERLEQTFAANASHELRTPLGTTALLLDVARDGNVDPETAALLDKLAVTNTRNLTIVDALLDLATIGANPPGHEETDLAGIAAQVLAEQAEAAANRDIDVRSALGSAPLRGDTVLLSRLTDNLVRNAIRHGDPGGWLSVGTTMLPDGSALLRVENSGEELAPEQITRLTEPFFRVRARLAEPVPSPGAGSGSQRQADTHGLGLALVDAIVTAHHGTLHLEAGSSGGLCVTVTLPGDVSPASR
ncbi:two-component system sensor histidine kinase VanS [Mycetocola sp. BIGb0189]|uniref:sensor histidine kinase n=1 Tax=Mycetocola sp. BIGb0189 TaxID=2940604 RepID=UPI00216A1B38|nr:HAMP domain-containing sensor histidine kinase [Mycetocola sp. BIGb0189]MCS4276335.1 two-component system sensor histidine kinase VanS [Mycetocola sp. BIGb0189]